MGVAGVRALLTMPVDAIPDLSENQVIVFTDWMGRSPQEIEDQITYPLSVNLQGLAGREGGAVVERVQLLDDQHHLRRGDRLLLRPRPRAGTALDRLDVPAAGRDPVPRPRRHGASARSSGTPSRGTASDLGELRAIQDWYVRYQLNSVPGVAEVASVGGAPREYQIDLDPNKLRAYGISLGEVYSAVARSNSAVGGRVIHQGNAEYLIRSVGWIESLDDIREHGGRPARRGTPIYVEDLGTVQMGPAFRRSVLEKDGKEVVGGVVLMRYGENPLEVTRRDQGEDHGAPGRGCPRGCGSSRSTTAPR